MDSRKFNESLVLSLTRHNELFGDADLKRAGEEYAGVKNGDGSLCVCEDLFNAFRQGALYFAARGEAELEAARRERNDAVGERKFWEDTAKSKNDALGLLHGRLSQANDVNAKLIEANQTQSDLLHQKNIRIAGAETRVKRYREATAAVAENGCRCGYGGHFTSNCEIREALADPVADYLIKNVDADTSEAGWHDYGGKGQK